VFSMESWCWLAFFTIVSFFAGYVYRWRGIPFLGKWRTPFVGQAPRYAIGILTGSSLSELSTPKGVVNPVLSPEAVTDVRASAVADPFLFRRQEKWHMFMEVKNRARRRGEIGLATSLDGLKWCYQEIVLREPFHLSYPFILECQGEIWMIPETSKDRSVRLYRATDFPTQWKFEKRLLEGLSFSDPTVFSYKDSWWMFVCRNESEDLLLYYADALTGLWHQHPRSPVVYAQPDKARCAGRPVRHNGKLIRFAQDCSTEYGKTVRAFQIERLDREEYFETELKESPILFPSGKGWNEHGMHHIDMQSQSDGYYLAAVDGWRLARDFGLMY